VRSAIRNAGFAFPNERITVNLAPADLRKEGAAFDLPIALGILTATGSVRGDGLGVFAVVGELALDGQIQPVRGALAVGLECRSRGIATLLVPRDNAAEANAVDGVRVLAAGTLRDAVALLNGEAPAVAPPAPEIERIVDDADLADVRGQAHAKRALEIAAAGGHNLAFVGPPGSGKSMMAARLPGLLPLPMKTAHFVILGPVRSGDRAGSTETPFFARGCVLVDPGSQTTPRPPQATPRPLKSKSGVVSGQRPMLAGYRLERQ